MYDKDSVDKTSLTLTNNYGSYSITINNIDMTIDSVRDDLLIPMLLSAGYHPDNIKTLFNMEEF